MMVKLVYANGKAYFNDDDLAKAVEKAWSEIDQNYIKKLYDSMPRRVEAVVSSKGQATKY